MVGENLYQAQYMKKIWKIRKTNNQLGAKSSIIQILLKKKKIFYHQ